MDGAIGNSGTVKQLVKPKNSVINKYEKNFIEACKNVKIAFLSKFSEL